MEKILLTSNHTKLSDAVQIAIGHRTISQIFSLLCKKNVCSERRRKKMYCIKDEITGNYLNSRAFTRDSDRTWYFISYTGRIGTDFYATREQAEEGLKFLSIYNKRSRANRNIHIVEINEDLLPIGFKEIITL